MTYEEYPAKEPNILPGEKMTATKLKKDITSVQKQDLIDKIAWNALNPVSRSPLKEAVARPTPTMPETASVEPQSVNHTKLPAQQHIVQPESQHINPLPVIQPSTLPIKPLKATPLPVQPTEPIPSILPKKTKKKKMFFIIVVIVVVLIAILGGNWLYIDRTNKSFTDGFNIGTQQIFLTILNKTMHCEEIPTKLSDNTTITLIAKECFGGNRNG